MQLFRSLIISITLFFSLQMYAQETRLMIRAKAKDAKFIGTSIGGARILVKDVQTGKILAEGITKGSTGNTNKIMNEPWSRGADLAEDSTAGFNAQVDISEPTFVEISAYAPVSKKQAAVVSSTQLWLIPGKHIITGDGIVLEIPGFIVDIISPQTHERINSETEVKFLANIVMMCGCPITEGGLWNASAYEVKAIIKDEQGNSSEIELEITDKTSTFSGKKVLKKGLYEITVYAYDPKTGNTGLDKTNIIIN